MVWCLVICLYTFGWSNLYKGLSLETQVTLLSFIIINLIFGLASHNRIKKILFYYRKQEPSKVNLSIKLAFLFALIFVDFLYAGTLPVANVFIPSSEQVKFIPVIHTLLVIISVYLSQLFFHYYLKSSDSKALVLFCFLGVLYPILLGGRGILFVNIFGFILGYYIIKGVPFKLLSLVKLLVVVVLLSFLFGVLGEIRSMNSKVKESNGGAKSLIYSISAPSKAFDSTGLNENFLWPYIYLVSPLGNLNHLIDSKVHFENDTAHYLLENYIPNFIQKQIQIQEIKKNKSNLVVDIFNTYTAYGAAYQQYSWLGIFLYFTFVQSIIFILVYFVKSNVVSVVLLQFLVLGHGLSWFSNLYVKEIIVGPIIISFLVLVYGYINKLK